MLVLAFLQINITYIALLIRFCFVFNAPPYDTPLFESNPSKPSKILKMTPHQNGRPQPPSQVKNDKTLKQKQRWHPRGQKWQPEVDIFSLKLHWLDKFAQQLAGGGGLIIKQGIQMCCVRQKLGTEEVHQDIKLPWCPFSLLNNVIVKQTKIYQ